MTQAEAQQLDAILFPPLSAGQTKAAEGNLRFSYYTTAETATRILSNQEIWLRNTAVMNDYTEVQHGMECLHNAWQNTEGAKRLKELLSVLSPGAVDRLQLRYDGWNTNLQQNTFITCISEHEIHEDLHGRLSMWRAYGGDAGVAFVFKPDFLASENHAIGAYSHPVSYLDREQFAASLSATADRVETAVEFFRIIKPEDLEDSFFAFLLWATLATKHPAFAEEREWRVVAVPPMWPSKILAPSIEVIRGIPQPILKLPFRNVPDHGVIGLQISDLLDRVIIGPCEHPAMIYRAMTDLLIKAGVSDASEKVYISGIPLRR